MGTQSQEYQMILQIQGAQQADDLRAKIALTEQKIASLWSTMKHDPSGFASAIKADAAALLELKSKLQDAEKAAGGLSGGARNGGRALLEFSRAAEDAQYGIAGVLNNLPGLVSALGGTAGLTAGISLAAVGMAQLYKHWDEIGKLWGGGHTQTEAERMDELAKKTARTADETERLAKWERERSAIQHQETTPTKQEAAQTKQVNEAVVETGVDKVDATIKEIHGPAVRNATDQTKIDKRDAAQRNLDSLKKRRAAGENIEIPKFLQETVDAINKEIDDKVNAWVRDFRGKIATDPKALEGFTRDMQRAGKSTAEINRFKDAMKTPEDLEEEKAQEHLDQVEREHASAKAKWEEDYRRKDEEEEIKAGELADKVERDHASAKAKWEDDYRQKEEEDEKKAGELADKVERDHASAKAQWEMKGEEDAESKRVDRAKDNLELHPELDDQIKGELVNRQMGGQSADDAGKAVEERLAKVFQDKYGVTEDHAKDMAHDQVQGNAKEIRDSLQKGPEQDKQEVRNSETIGIREYINKIQGSVSNEDVQKDQRDIMQKILDKISEDPAARAAMIATYG